MLLSVRMTVVRIRTMRVLVDPGFVTVRVGMGARRRLVVVMVVMPIVVRVGMVVLERLVTVLVPVALGEVQHQPGDE